MLFQGFQHDALYDRVTDPEQKHGSQALTSICSQAPDEPTGPWTIYITGHSLGGALATLLARDVVRLPWAREGRVEVVMYNFGSPRVGNRAFAEEYNRTVGTSWRVCNHRDIIPTVRNLDSVEDFAPRRP